jgi:hypothetical protein
MTAIASVLAVLVFLAAFSLLRVVDASRRAMRTAQEAVAAMSDPTLSEEVRERTVQRGAISLIGSFVSIVLRGAGALLASLSVVFAFEVAGLGRAEEVIHVLSRWDVLVFSTVAITAGWVLRRRFAS